MKKSKILVPAVALLALGMAASTTATVAWYSTTSANKHANLSATSAMSVQSIATELGDVYFNVSPTSGYATKLVMTNRAGRTYYKTGSHYEELKSTDNGSTVATSANQSTGYKQGSATFEVKLTTTSGGSTAPSTAALASIAGTYTVKVAASDQAKASLAKTTALVTDNATPVYNFAAPTGGAASGSLGAEASQVVPVMDIVIDGTGAVTYQLYGSDGNLTGSASAWSTVSTAQTSSAVYYGLECNVDSAEATPAESGALTPSVYDVAASANISA